MYSEIILCLFGFTLSQVICAPRSKGKFTTYDQKQTGDYNIQLHLKDFQIVALLNDDTLSAFGDYEYNYDYSDLTVKPHNSTTTTPNQVSSSSVSPEIPSIVQISSTQKPSTTSSSYSEKPTANNLIQSTTQLSTTEKPISQTSANTQDVANETSTLSKTTTVSTTSTERLPNSIKLGEEFEYQPLKIKQQHTSSVTIVPLEENDPEPVKNDTPALGEILHYRKCASGYSRDKRGRCRKTRRPGVIPFGISRLASSLAAKFRQAASEEMTSSSSSSESDEN